MKLDVNALRYLSSEEFRTLQAVELGQKNVRLILFQGMMTTSVVTACGECPHILQILCRVPPLHKHWH
jgi:hypothetical protein